MLPKRLVPNWACSSKAPCPCNLGPMSRLHGFNLLVSSFFNANSGETLGCAQGPEYHLKAGRKSDDLMRSLCLLTIPNRPGSCRKPLHLHHSSFGLTNLLLLLQLQALLLPELAPICTMCPGARKKYRAAALCSVPMHILLVAPLIEHSSEANFTRQFFPTATAGKLHVSCKIPPSYGKYTEYTPIQPRHPLVFECPHFLRQDRPARME